jgi:hypothetical protein
VDPRAAQQLVEIAARYLAGDNLKTLAAEYGWRSVANLRRVLRDRSGPVWVQEFKDAGLRIHERVETAVPPLLDADTIRRVRDRLVANRTYLKRPANTINFNLLAGFIRCETCGTCLVAQVMTSGSHKRYYRHQSAEGRPAECPHRCLWVPADKVEADVLRDLRHHLTDPARVEAAVAAACPDRRQERERRQRLAGELEKVVTQRNRVIDAIADGLLSKSQAKAKLDRLTSTEGALRKDLAAVDAQLAAVPDPGAVRQWVEVIGGLPVLVSEAADGSQKINVGVGCSWDDQRHFLEQLFADPLADGTPAGVYVRVTGGAKYRPRAFAYTIRGRLDFQVVALDPTPGRRTARSGGTGPAYPDTRGCRRGRARCSR